MLAVQHFGFVLDTGPESSGDRLRPHLDGSAGESNPRNVCVARRNNDTSYQRNRNTRNLGRRSTPKDSRWPTIDHTSPVNTASYSLYLGVVAFRQVAIAR